MLKILIIAPEAYPVSSTTGGSVEICIYQIGKRIASRDQVTILSRSAKGLPSKQKIGNLYIKRVPHGPNYLQNVIREAQKEHWDLIQVDNRPHFIPLIRKHFPHSSLILNLHSLLFMSLLSKEKQNEVVKKATAILCNSHHIRTAYCNRFPSYASKFHTIYLGTDLSRFRLPTKKEKLAELSRYRLSSSAYHILNVGRIVPGKGVHLLVKAAGILKKKYPRICLLIVGPLNNRAYRERLIQEAKRANLNMRILGPKSPASVHRAYWLADLFVCPTQMIEAFGLVVVEALASGVPVIASDRGGLKEVLGGGTRGLLVNNYRSAIGFATAMEQFIRNKALAKTKAEKGRQYVLRNFGWDGVAANYRNFYLKFKK